MKNSIIYILITLLFMTSCHPERQYENATLFQNSDFPKEYFLNGTVIKKEIFSIPLGIVCKDSLLIIYNAKGDYAINSLNLNTWKNIGEYIDWGRGPGEVLDPKKLIIQKNEVYLFDKIKNQLLIYDVDQFRFPQEIKPKRNFAIKGSAEGILPTQDSLLIALSWSYPNYRFTLFKEDGSFVQNVSEMPQIKNKTFTDMEKIVGFECAMEIFPNGNIALIYKRTDLLELYTSKGKLLKRLHGPDHFFPELKEIRSEGVVRIKPDIGKEKDSYRWSSVTNNELWCLYAGKIFNPKDELKKQILFDRILVFNHELQPLKIYNLDIPIRAFTIDTEKRIIYGLQENSLEPFVTFSY